MEQWILSCSWLVSLFAINGNISTALQQTQSAVSIGYAKNAFGKYRTGQFSFLSVPAALSSEVLLDNVVTVSFGQIGQYAGDLIAVFQEEIDVPVIYFFSDTLDCAFFFGFPFKML